MRPEPTMSARLMGSEAKAVGLKGQYGQHREDCVRRHPTVESLKTVGEIDQKREPEVATTPGPRSDREEMSLGRALSVSWRGTTRGRSGCRA